MARYRSTQNNFNGGVLGERLYGRTDIQQYANGAKTLDGFIPLRQGGARTSPNTIIEAAIINAIPYNPTANEVNGGYLYSDNINSVFYKSQGSDTIYTVNLRESPNAFDARNRFKDSTVSLEDLHIAQVGDILLMTFKDGLYQPHIFLKDPVTEEFELFPWDYAYSHTYRTGQIGAPAPFAMYPYGDRSVSGVAFTINAGTLTATGAGLTNFFSKPESYYLGKYIKLHYITTTQVFQITGKISDTELSVVDAIAATDTHPATDDWQITIFGGDTNPTSLALHEGRLVFGGQSEDKLEITGSLLNNLFFFMEERLLQAVDKSGDVAGLNFYGDPQDSDPYRFTITSTQYAKTEFLISGRDLFVGSTGGVYVVSGGDSIISRTSIDTYRTSYAVCLNAQPTVAEESVIFADDSGRIYELKYSFDIRGYQAKELTSLYRPIVDIEGIWYDPKNSTIWVSSGSVAERQQLKGIVYVPTLGVTAWTITDLLHDNVFVGPTNTLHYRTEIEGYPYIVRMSSQEDEYRLRNVDFAFSDALGVVKSAPYANQTVTIFKSSALGVITLVGDVTLDASGETTLEANTAYIIGLKYSAKIETLPIVSQAEAGSGDAAISRIDRVTPRLVGTTGGKIGTRENYMNNLFALSDDQPFSGPKQISLDCGQELDNIVIITTDEPYPMEISALVFRGQVFE